MSTPGTSTITGHTRDGEPELNWQALCQPGQTLVFYMGHKALDRLCARLIEHVRARILAGESGPELGAAVRAEAERALDLVADGLGGYAPKA